MTERRKKILKVVILVVVVLGICFGGIVAVDLLMPKEKVEDAPIPSNNPSPTISPLPSEETVEEKEVSMELADKLYKMLYIPYDCRNILYSHYKNDVIKPDDFSNEEKNDIILWNLIHGDYSVGKNEFYNPKYLKQQIIDMKNQIFGKDVSFEIINDETSGCLKFHLEGDNTYSVQIQCGLDECHPSNITKFSKLFQRGNKIILEILTVFLGYDGDYPYTAYYYSDFNKTKLLGRKAFSGFEDYWENSRTIDWNYYESKASIYRYTYQDNGDGTYTFIQIEKAN